MVKKIKVAEFEYFLYLPSTGLIFCHAYAKSIIAPGSGEEMAVLWGGVWPGGGQSGWLL